jgi:serine protease Do
MYRLWEEIPRAIKALGLCGLVLLVSDVLAFPLPAFAEDDPKGPLPAVSGLDKILAGGVPEGRADLKAFEQHVHQVLERVRPCTVGVDDGSGVVVSEDGHVLTVGHLGVRAGREVSITFPDGRRGKGKTLGNDHGVDAGMVKIDGKGPWPHAEMGKSGNLKPGQWCLAIGYPVTYKRGKPAMVRLGRVLRHDDLMIITDCKIMGGDSGGPLFDLHGRLVGISSRCDDSVTFNIHVPIDQFHESWKRLVAGEDFNSLEPTYAFLGVAPEEDNDKAVIGRVVQGSGAEKAGLKAGDVILKFDGKPLDRYAGLVSLVQRKKPGDKVEIEARRGEEIVTVEATLGRRK